MPRVWVPWALWEAYGDLAVLSETFDSMAAHVDHVITLLSDTGLWDTGFQFGDWLDPNAPPDRPDLAETHPGVVATASLYRTARLVAEVAHLLGRAEDGQRFAALATDTRAAFNRHYVGADGTVRSDTQTAYTLAIVFGLLDDRSRTAAGDRLVQLVRESGHHIATGFAGTAYVLDALTETGHLDDAYQLLLQRECPSWLYPVTMGATTIWERWDSILPDGTVNPGEMTSFNHYALGAVADWMHRTIGGVRLAAPGCRRVRIAPRPGGGITLGHHHPGDTAGSASGGVDDEQFGAARGRLGSAGRDARRHRHPRRHSPPVDRGTPSTRRIRARTPIARRQSASRLSVRILGSADGPRSSGPPPSSRPGAQCASALDLRPAAHMEVGSPCRSRCVADASTPDVGADAAAVSAPPTTHQPL